MTLIGVFIVVMREKRLVDTGNLTASRRRTIARCGQARPARDCARARVPPASTVRPTIESIAASESRPPRSCVAPGDCDLRESSASASSSESPCESESADRAATAMRARRRDRASAGNVVPSFSITPRRSARQRSSSDLAFDLHEVGLLGFPARIGESRLQRAASRSAARGLRCRSRDVRRGACPARGRSRAASPCRPSLVNCVSTRNGLLNSSSDGHQRTRCRLSMCSAVVCTRSMKRCTAAAFSPRRQARISGAVSWALSASLR